MNAETTPRYDAAGDAEALAAPLEKWARLGFLRGFAGIRKEIVPQGTMTLPSKAFAEVARESLSALPPDSAEYAERHEYVERVEEILRSRQNAFFEAHYRNSILGHVCDFALGLVFVALVVGLFVRLGPQSHVTLALLALIGVKLVFLQVSVRRAVRIAQEAFQTRKETIALPWEVRNA